MTHDLANLQIRRATAQDLPQLAQIYRQAVLTIGPSRYTAAQVQMWASFAQQPGFADFVLTATTFVAVVQDEPVGFCGLLSNGHVASLYVSAAHSRRGIGSALLHTVIELATQRGLVRLSTDASLFSRPVFERHGFVLERVESVLRQGVVFDRYHMVRTAAPQ